MNDRLIITFEKSQEDIPVLIVGRENHNESNIPFGLEERKC